MSKRCAAEGCFNSNTSNKGLTFFAFPKSRLYGDKWAEASGRRDLVGKSLDQLIKYYLCSQHFEDECFTDPATRQNLNKRSRPEVVAPIPSIFFNNMSRFCPDIPKTDDQLLCDIASPPVNKDDEDLTMQLKPLIRIKRQVLRPQIEIIEDVPLVEPVDSFIMLVNDPLESTVCRLCGAEFSKTATLLPIFPTNDDDGDTGEIATSVETLLPGMVRRNDGRPQKICSSCWSRVQLCMQTIQSFRTVQEKQFS